VLAPIHSWRKLTGVDKGQMMMTVCVSGKTSTVINGRALSVAGNMVGAMSHRRSKPNTPSSAQPLKLNAIVPGGGMGRSFVGALVRSFSARPLCLLSIACP
jgi:hypothetical protein